MKRVLGVMSAVLLVLVGALLAALGGLGLAVFGTDGAYSGPAQNVASQQESLAVVADLTGVEIDIPYHQLLGEATLSVRDAAGGELFLGQAPQAAVDTYLFSLPYDLATKNGTWSLIPVPGVGAEAADPASQTFWVSSASGAEASLTFSEQEQPNTIVIMNSDATAGVSAVITVGFAGERLGTYSITALAAGVVLILLTFTVALSLRRRRRRRAAAALASAEAGQAAAAQPPGTDGPAPASGSEPTVDLADRHAPQPAQSHADEPAS